MKCKQGDSILPLAVGLEDKVMFKNGVMAFNKLLQRIRPERIKEVRDYLRETHQNEVLDPIYFVVNSPNEIEVIPPIAFDDQEVEVYYGGI